MEILHTVKFYNPSKGGMESVVQHIIEGITKLSEDTTFTVYANSHFELYRKQTTINSKIRSIKEFTPFHFKSQPLNFIYPSLKKLLIESDIVHHHYPFPNMEFALLRHKKILKDKKLIITWHANIHNSRWHWIQKFYDPLVKQLLNIAHQIIVTSPQLLEYSPILKDYKDKVKIIPLSFDPSISALLVSRKVPKNRRFRLLFVGKLRDYKGIGHLIDAIQDLEVELTIVGDGENEKALKNQADALKLKDSVTFLKGISSEALKQVYQLSDLFILPSINEAEAFGVVQLEAMANGLPVINTNLKSGVPYVSLHEKTGLTVEPNSSISLKEAIIKITTDKNLYELFSKNAIERSKEFSREKMAKSYLELYKS